MNWKLRFLTISLLFSLGACSLLGPKPHDVYHRKDIKVSKNSKLIIFPAMNWSGDPSAVETGVDSAISAGWANLYGSKNVIPAGPAISKIVEKSGFKMSTLVKAMDDVSMVEQLLQKDKRFKKFVHLLTDKFGQYDFALALVRGNEAQYDNKSEVRVHLGHFSTKNLTWKWITKIKDQKGLLGNWTAAYNTMVNSSFEHAQEAYEAAGSRLPASN